MSKYIWPVPKVRMFPILLSLGSQARTAESVLSPKYNANRSGSMRGCVVNRRHFSIQQTKLLPPPPRAGLAQVERAGGWETRSLGHKNWLSPVTSHRTVFPQVKYLFGWAAA